MYAERPRRVEHLLAFAERWADRPHIVQGERVVTFDELRRAIHAKARELTDLGVGQREHVLILGWNTPEWIINFWACLQVGAVPVLANTWWSPSELADALEAVRPVLTLADAHGASRMPEGWRGGPWETDQSYGRPSVPFATSPGENEPAVIIFTSGTAGR